MQGGFKVCNFDATHNVKLNNPWDKKVVMSDLVKLGTIPSSIQSEIFLEIHIRNRKVTVCGYYKDIMVLLVEEN
jgi:hypothetical protein